MGARQLSHSMPNELCRLAGVPGCWLMLANDIMKEKMIQPWAGCALLQECIAPAGATLFGCHGNGSKHKNWRYIGCHRFDQSALNVILTKEFGVQVFQRLWNRSIFHEVWTRERKPSDTFHVVGTCM